MSENRAQNEKSARQAASAVADASAAMTNAATSAAQKGAETLQQNSAAATDAVRQGGQAVADVARRASEVGAETLRRSADAVAQGQHQIAQDAAGRLQTVSRTVAETTQGTVDDMRILLQLPKVADRGLQDIQHTMTSLVEGVVQSNLRMTQEMFRLASPAAFIELQQRFVRDYMGALMEGSAALVRAVHQTAEQTLPPLEQHLRQRAQSASNGVALQRAAE